ncbi:hypothetical protein BRO54_3883 [Geobacillus proteiniphilus]|uniref:Uncharacterized protein n=1 Tax=Geobacillus proteiniphilus TaxID=860353 RepID=A0A1Q5SDR1_9BACL|nr:hypothetical protein BRO54_3883 [Geobacillus proteiniphilus]
MECASLNGSSATKDTVSRWSTERILALLRVSSWGRLIHSDIG